MALNQNRIRTLEEIAVAPFISVPEFAVLMGIGINEAYRIVKEADAEKCLLHAGAKRGKTIINREAIIEYMKSR